MNQYSYSKNIFSNVPVEFEDWGQKDYDELCGIEKYAYQTYRYFIKDYLKNHTEITAMDINCGLGYGLACLKSEYNFKKCIGYNNDQNILEACKIRHSNIPFYKDFILSKQKDANLIFSIDAFDQYDNKSALLLRLSQALADDGILCIIQNSTDENEYNNYIEILQGVHGLKKLYNADITAHVAGGIKKFENFADGSSSIPYATVSSKISRYDDFRYYVTIMKR